MIDKPVAYPRPAQQAIDALSAAPLERVSSGVPQPRAHDLADLPTLFGVEQVLPDDVAVAVEGCDVCLDDRGLDGGPAGRRPLVSLRQIAPEVLQRCDGLIVDVHLHSPYRAGTLRCLPTDP